MKKLTALIPFALAFTVACGQTDAGITTEVKTKLAADDTVKAYQIDVDTQDKVVTLSGNVDTIIAREQAVLLARQAAGVRDVVDNLRVADAAATTGIDANEAERRAGDAADSVGDASKDAAEEVGDASKDAGRSIGDKTKEAAKKTGNAAKRGAEAVSDGAKKAGSAVKDAVTDNDPDTNRDGK